MSDEFRASHGEQLDLAAAFALGVLPPMEADAVREHLAGCEACRAEYEAVRPAVDALALTGEEEVDRITAARMKRRLLAQIAPAPPRALRPAYALAAAACIGLIFTALDDLGVRTQIATTRAHLGELGRQVADLSAPDARRYPVPGGTVVVRGAHTYLVMSEMPALAAGHVFQAWTLAKSAKTVAPSVTFVPAGGSTVVEIPDPPADLVAVAVSVEPDGGSVAPTTKPLFVRSL
jgi:anti-sigma-K factor RskA